MREDMKFEDALNYVVSLADAYEKNGEIKSIETQKSKYEVVLSTLYGKPFLEENDDKIVHRLKKTNLEKVYRGSILSIIGARISQRNQYCFYLDHIYTIMAKCSYVLAKQLKEWTLGLDYFGTSSFDMEKEVRLAAEYSIDTDERCAAKATLILLERKYNVIDEEFGTWLRVESHGSIRRTFMIYEVSIDFFFRVTFLDYENNKFKEYPIHHLTNEEQEKILELKSKLDFEHGKSMFRKDYRYCDGSTEKYILVENGEIQKISLGYPRQLVNEGEEDPFRILYRFLVDLFKIQK